MIRSFAILATLHTNMQIRSVSLSCVSLSRSSSRKSITPSAKLVSSSDSSVPGILEKLDLEATPLKSEHQFSMSKAQEARKCLGKEREFVEHYMATLQAKEPKEFIEHPFLSELMKVDKNVLKNVTPILEPRNYTIAFFPGENAVFVGMGKQLLRYPRVSELFRNASEVMGYDLLKVCLNGPLSELRKPLFSLPAVFVTSLAAGERLRMEHGKCYDSVITTAGFGVGELSALVYSGAIGLKGAMRLVARRAQLCQQLLGESTLIAVKGKHTTNWKKMCQSVREFTGKDCWVSAKICPDVRLIGGHTDAIRYVKQNKDRFDLLHIKVIPDSVASNTPTMSAVARELQGDVNSLSWNDPKFKIITSCSGLRYYTKSNFRRLLQLSLSTTVNWEGLLHKLFDRSSSYGFPRTFEVGPGNQLGFAMKATNERAHHLYQRISV